MAAVLQHENDAKTLTTYLLEARRLGIKMILPDINRSEKSFALDGNGIRFGLTNIRFIADAAASNIIKGRPYRSYRDFTDYAAVKGSGLSSRIVSAINKVNAAPFGDNARRDVRENMYEYLGVPYFDDSWMTEDARARLTPCSLYNEEQPALMYGLVIDITTKPGASWTRIELVDDSGVVTFFAGKTPPVEVGKMYAVVAGNKSILDAVELADIQETDKVWAKYLMAKKISLAPEANLVVEFKSRKTKAGKNMANAIVVDHEGTLKSLLVFPQQYPAGLKHMKPGNLIEVTTGYTKDGTPFVDRVRSIV
jgi:DNA polymerase-3 subunit alpha